MEERQSRALGVYRSALAWLMALADAEAGLEIAHVRARLAASLARIDEWSRVQAKVGFNESRVFNTAAAALRENQLRPLAALARPLFRDEPRVLHALTVPAKRRYRDVTAAAAAMLDALQPHKRFLASSGVDVRRLVQLRKDLASLRRLERAASQTPGRQQATRALKEAFSEAAKHMKTLRVIVPIGRSATVRADWARIVQIPKKMGRPSKRRLAARRRANETPPA
jgi:hypothetical protein